MEQYLEHAHKILTDRYTGYKPNRTGIDTISRFGHENEYDLQDGFPLLTTKKLHTKSIIHELLWFMKGDSNIKYLVDNGVNIWNEWAFDRYLQNTGQAGFFEHYTPHWKKFLDAYVEQIKINPEFAQTHGELGPVYGSQWRKWQAPDGKVIDQFGDLVKGLKRSPSSRRLIVTAWNPAEVASMALPPCHTLWHVNVQDDELTLKLYQRSCDMFLGVPFNIASYALLAQILAQEAGLKPGRFIHSFGDAHFYCGSGERGAWYGRNLDTLKSRVRDVKSPEGYLDIKEWLLNEVPAESPGSEGQDHVPMILEQMSRETRQKPRMIINSRPIDDLTIDNFTLEGYDPHPAIKGKVAV